jgi:tRNA nucleotidyltransferase (CCA-adding enzyme)
MKQYLVGGAVRDQLLNIPVKDRDWVVTEATADTLLAQGYKQVGKDFPVFLHPKSKEEYALARTERKTAKGYRGFSFHADQTISLEEDLQRRDLTINALAQDETGQIFDYCNGQKDLEKRILRHVSPAFREDPVRILRIARFLARFHYLGFRIAKSTMQLMQDMVQAGEVDALVIERVWQETSRALSEKNPEAFFETLRACGALAVLFPEIDALFGVPQVKTHHPEIDTGVHTIMVLQQAAQLSDKAEVRFAALTHDLGKATTKAEILPHHYGHEGRSKRLVTKLCRRYKVPKRFRSLAEQVANYHTHVHKAFELKPQTLLKVLEQLGAFRQPNQFEDFLIACKADSRGRLGYEQKDYPQVEYYLAILNLCKQIKVQDVITAGFKGKAIAQQLRKQRLAAIRTYKNSIVPTKF